MPEEIISAFPFQEHVFHTADVLDAVGTGGFIAFVYEYALGPGEPWSLGLISKKNLAVGKERESLHIKIPFKTFYAGSEKRWFIDKIDAPPFANHEQIIYKRQINVIFYPLLAASEYNRCAFPLVRLKRSFSEGEMGYLSKTPVISAPFSNQGISFSSLFMPANNSGMPSFFICGANRSAPSSSHNIIKSGL